MVFGADMKFDTGKAMTAAKDAAAIAPNAPGTSACDLLLINRICDLKLPRMPQLLPPTLLVRLRVICFSSIEFVI
jgi:hypothetical protein